MRNRKRNTTVLFRDFSLIPDVPAQLLKPRLRRTELEQKPSRKQKLQ